MLHGVSPGIRRFTLIAAALVAVVLALFASSTAFAQEPWPATPPYDPIPTGAPYVTYAPTANCGEVILTFHNTKTYTAGWEYRVDGLRANGTLPITPHYNSAYTWLYSTVWFSGIGTQPITVTFAPNTGDHIIEYRMTFGGEADDRYNWQAPIIVSTDCTPCTTACYVDAVNGNDANGGMSTYPKQTIQAANSQVSAGGTVYVAAGSYTGEVVVDKQVTFLGDAGHVASLNGGFKLVPGANSVKIDGFAISGGTTTGGTAGILVWNGDNHTFSNNRLNGPGGATAVNGIEVAGGVDNVTVEDNIFTGWNSCVYFNPGTSHDVDHNTFNACRVAIGVDGATNSTFTNNLFAGPFSQETVEHFSYTAASTGLTFALNSFPAGPAIITHPDGVGGGGPINAEYNWWGQATGPAAGQIDATSAPVDTTPFLTDGTNALPPAIPGFEPASCGLTCYVNTATGNDANSGVSPASAKKTIQGGVDAALPNATIFVATGVYNEKVSVNKAGLNIRGTSATVNEGFGIYADGVKITGFTIKDGLHTGTQAGVYVQANSAYIASNTFNGVAANARGVVVAIGYGNVTIAANTFDNIFGGVYLNPPGNNNRLISNTFRDVDYGISMDNQASAIIKFNDFVGPFVEGIGLTDANPGTVVAYNQFLAPTFKIVHHGASYTATPGTLNAENNWWNSQDGPATGQVVVSGGGTVDTVPFVTNEPNIAYDSIFAQFPGNVASLGFEAYSAKELGDHIAFQFETSRRLAAVEVMMSSWGCESGDWTGGSGVCTTTPGATFNHDITLNIYAVDNTNPAAPVPGALKQTVTQTFAIPYRPSADPSCPNPNTYRDADGVCNNGLAHKIVFDFSAQNIQLPDEVIYGITYNTSHHGYAPIGTGAACYTEPGGCGYDSLNIGLRTFGPFAGTNVDADSLYWYTTHLPFYTPPLPPSGSFREDADWPANQPNVTFEMAPANVYIENASLDLNSGDVAIPVPVKINRYGAPINALQFDVDWPTCLSVDPTSDAMPLGSFMVNYDATPGDATSTRVVVSPPAFGPLIPDGVVVTLPFKYTGGGACSNTGIRSYEFTPSGIVCGGSDGVTDVPCTGTAGTVTVDYNDNPVFGTVNPLSVLEHLPYSGNVVGVTDPDSGDTITYALANGCTENGGVNHNSDFALTSGGALSAAPVDYELGVKNSRWVCIQASDNHGGSAKQAFNITVTNDDDVARGDCNVSGSVNATDLSATVLEIFDETTLGNGGQDFTDSNWLTAPYGAFRGSPEGCDSNEGQIVGAADLACTVRIIFGLGATCTGGVIPSSLQPAFLNAPAAPQTGAVAITLDAQGHSIAAASFTIKLDPSLTFDAADANGDGVPDAVAFHVPDSLLRMAVYSAEQHAVKVVVAGVSMPLPTIDGAIATVTLGGSGSVRIESASVGNTDGMDVPVQVKLGGEVQQLYRMFLPSVTQ